MTLTEVLAALPSGQKFTHPSFVGYLETVQEATIAADIPTATALGIPFGTQIKVAPYVRYVIDGESANLVLSVSDLLSNDYNTWVDPPKFSGEAISGIPAV